MSKTYIIYTIHADGSQHIIEGTANRCASRITNGATESEFKRVFEAIANGSSDPVHEIERIEWIESATIFETGGKQIKPTKWEDHYEVQTLKDTTKIDDPIDTGNEYWSRSCEYRRVYKSKKAAERAALKLTKIYGPRSVRVEKIA